MSTHRHGDDIGIRPNMWRHWVALRLIEPETRKWRRPEVYRHLPHFRSYHPRVARSTVTSEITWSRTRTHNLFLTHIQYPAVRWARTHCWFIIITIIIISSMGRRRVGHGRSAISLKSWLATTVTQLSILICAGRSNWRHHRCMYHIYHICIGIDVLIVSCTVVELINWLIDWLID